MLGCTHFIFVKNLIQSILPEDINILDGNFGTVKELKRRLEENNLQNNSLGKSYISINSTADNVEDKDKLEKLFKVAIKNEDYFAADNI